MTRPRLVVLVVLLLGAALGALTMRLYRGVPGDFRRYHRAGRLVATGRADLLYDDAYLAGRHVYEEERAEEKAAGGGDSFREEEFKYLPATAILVAPLGSMRLYDAKVVWGAWNGFLIALLFVACAAACRGATSAWWALVPAALLGNLADNNLQLGQLNASSLVPATLGMICLARRKEVAAGTLVGLGAVVKFMPVFLGFWFLWKRRWKAFAVLVGAVLAIGWGLPALTLGPTRATDLTRQYFNVRSGQFTAGDAEDLPTHSLKTIVYRTVGSPLPAEGAPDPAARLRIAVLPGDVVWWIVLVLDALILGAVLFAARGALAPPEDRNGMLEAGAVLTALTLLSPEARPPHFLILALALTALTFAFVERRAGGAPWPRRAKWAFGLASIGVLLLNTVPRTYVRKTLSLFFTDVCALGFAAGLVIVACLLARRKVSGNRAPTP